MRIVNCSLDYISVTHLSLKLRAAIKYLDYSLLMRSCCGESLSPGALLLFSNAYMAFVYTTMIQYTVHLLYEKERCTL